MSPEKPRLLDGIDFVLLTVIDEVGWRWRVDVLDREDGRSVGSEEGFIEDCMPCGQARGLKVIGRPSNLGVCDVGSNLMVVQLLAGSVGRQVDGMEPDQVARFVVYGITPILVIVGLH